MDETTTTTMAELETTAALFARVTELAEKIGQLAAKANCVERVTAPAFAPAATSTVETTGPSSLVSLRVVGRRDRSDNKGD